MGDLAKTDLQELATSINAAHEAATGAAKSAIEHARECGELLIAAKAKVEHGGWLPWLTANCRVGERQARRYMRVAENWERIGKSDSGTDLTIKEAARLTEERQPDGLPELDDSHTATCLGEDDTLAMIIPLDEQYYYVGVINLEDGTVVEIHRGIIGHAVEAALERFDFKPAGEWSRKPLCADDMKYIMGVKAHWAKPENRGW